MKKISQIEKQLRTMPLQPKEKEARAEFYKSALFGGFDTADGSESSKECWAINYFAQKGASR